MNNIKPSSISKRARFIAPALAGVLAVGVGACGSSDTGGAAGASQKGGAINGAGATFPQPVYDELGARFADRQGTTVNYQGIGSGGGIAQFTAGTVDFGATDSAMKDEEVQAAQKKGEPVHVPSVFGAVTVSYNLEGVETGLKLDGGTVADMFLGKVKNWNDPAIAAANDGVELPDSPITVCHRSDESGTTKLFTTFLAAYSDEWKSGPGADKTVPWPTGTGAKGNDGVAACIKQNDSAVGYVEQAFALQNDFTFASLKNKSGNFVEPTLESTSAAGDGLEVPDDLRFDAIDAPGEQAYPIASATFLLVYQDMCKAGMTAKKAGLVKDWLGYVLGEGQKVAPELQYAALPDAVRTDAQAKVDGLECNGSPLGGGKS